LGAKKRENIVEKAQKTTKPCDFRLKQRFFGLNSYNDLSRVSSIPRRLGLFNDDAMTDFAMESEGAKKISG
jgi:hypothetical protein